MAEHPAPVASTGDPETPGADNGGSAFQHFQGYRGHYCALPTRVNPTIAACSFIGSGLRLFDISDVAHPKEVGYFIPAITDKTDKRCVGTGANERCKVAIQTNNVDVDDRGYIYIVDRANTGMHIIELTGKRGTPGEQAAGLVQTLRAATEDLDVRRVHAGSK